MSCVNRSSKEFKFLAERNNLSINALELITHKYWLENKTEDYFPSDVYIQAQLGKIPYEESSKPVRDLWEMEYKEPQIFKTLEALEDARREALRYFPEEAVTYHMNFKDNFVMIVRKPMARLSLNISDLTGKDSNDGQEQEDFNLVIKAFSKEQGKRNKDSQNIPSILQMSISSPQTFTFKDGTTVKAPFKLNYQQVDALNAMDEFIKSDKTSMTLSGYAGTGKTSLMEILAQKMDKQHKPIMFCASTNKAAAVLKERVSKSGFEAQTLNKVFGITVEVDANQAYNAKNLVNKLKDVDIPYSTTIIIDEASMINEENYRILNDIAKRNGLKIIYVGDAAQLAPVNETKISKVFRDQGHDVRTLSIVERTGDNAILKEATALRENKVLSGESSFNAKGQGVAYLKASNQQEKEAVIARFVPKLKENPNYFRILAYTNAAVANYNTKVRQLLGYNDSTPRVGEPITGYANWGYIYDRNGGKYRFINSEAYKVVKVESPRNARISLPDGSSVTMQAIPITLENSMGEKDTFNLMDIKDNQENRRIATQLAQMKSQLWNKARGLSGKAKAQILQQINAIDEFLFVNDNITEGNRTLQAKVFDFGYAMTVHKSQGSTFTHVLMDDVDIDKARDERNSSGIGMQDIAISWDDIVSDEPATYEVTGPMEDVDMGDWGSETPSTEGTFMQEPPKPQQENAANIRQQLKYVSVSRATDTVTIISNNVKKEDSPLNHIKDVPANSSVGSNPVASPKPVEQMSSQEVWRYMSAMQPLIKRSQVEYTPQGQPRQTYTVENGHIYNQKGTEVYPGKTVHKNMILANLAVKEGRAVVVTHPTSGEQYVVDNNQQITSVKTGKIMQWGDENGDRKRILAQAEIAFRSRIKAIKESGSALTQQLMDYLPLIGIDTHNREEMIQYLQEHGYNTIQQAIGNNNQNNSLNNYEANRRAEENQFFPEILGNAGREKEASRTLATAANDTRRGQSNDGKQKGFQKEKFLAHLEISARQQGTWIEDVNTLGERLKDKGGAENELYLSKDGKSYIKLNRFTMLDEQHNIEEFVDRINSHNEFEKYAPYSVLGFAEDSEGNVCIVLKQPIIKGKEATQRTIDYFLKEILNYEWKELSDGEEGWTNGIYEIWDADPSNVLIDSKRNLYFIDAVINNVERVKGYRKIDNIQFFITPQGEVYGFATPKGNLYFDETVISPEHPIHEYTHLWDRVVAKNNPKLWKQGITLMKQISLWQDIENDPNYGQKWKAMKGMTPQKLESLIASEVHARLVGVNGEQILNNLSKQKGAEGIIGKLKQWLLDFWKNLKATFSDWSEDDLNRLTLQDFTMMTVRDFADGFNPNAFSANQGPVSGSTTATTQPSFKYARNANGRPNYEVSSRGDKRFSAMTATFAPGTTLFGHDVSGRTIESVYQHGVKQGDWTTDNNSKTGAPKDKTIIKGNTENDSYTQGYLPLWQEWAKQNPQLIKELRQKAQGKVLTDMFASTAVSQARALADILNQPQQTSVPASYEGMITPDANTVFVFGSNPKGIHGAGAAATAKSKFGAIQGQGEGMQGSAYALPTKDLDKAKNTRWYRPGPKEEAEVKEWYKNHSFSEVQNHPLNAERTMTPQQIIESIQKLYEAARQNPDKQFKVSHYPFGKLSLNGYLGEEMLAMFKQAGEIPSNVVFNKEWVDHWNDNTFSTINQQENRSNKKANLIATTIAPYFNTSYQDYVAMSSEQQKQMREAFSKVAHEVAKAIGITLDMKQASFNIGGYQFEDGDSVVEPSFTFRLDTTPEKARLFAALMGDLGYEQQEAVVSSYRVDDYDSADGVKYYIKYSNPDALLPLLGKYGIKNFTYDKTKGELSVLSFDAEDLKKFDKLVEDLNKIEDGEKYNIQTEAFKSSYDAKGDRKNLYETWDSLLREEQGRKGYNSQLHSLVQEALSKLQEPQQAPVPEASASAQTNEEPLDTSAIFNNPSSTEVTVEDKMKPWRSDPSKQNISRRIYLKGQKSKGYFEVVKDFENNYYSVHFKPTDSDNPNAFSKEEKEILFQAVADTLPVGSKLSTWGELSRGGIAGLERFSKLGFAKSGERTVTMKGTGEEVNIPVYTKFPNTTQRVSLLGYEYFTEATEDTLVDAPWKIPLLQQLDEQFSTANPEGRNEEILEQMKAILEAESFEDWQNNTNSETKQQMQKNLDEYDKLITQLNNLLASDVITASEVRHVAELVVNAISDNLTQIQKEKGLAEQQFPTLNSKLDFQTASRKDIIQTIGIDRLIYRAKLLFDPENNEYEDLETLEQADLIIDNWDAIMTLAADIFAANEGVGISKDFSKGNWQSVNGQKVDFDNFNDYENDPDAMAEETKDEQEHWQIEQRTIDILNSMSAMVRLALHECYQIDKDGNTVMSKWGIPERVNARKAVNSILRWTQGSLSLEDMIAKLSEKQGQHPWLSQLITRLSDKTGAETDFQSQFYGVFAKHFQLYSIVLLEDGKYHSMAVNSHPALSEAMQTITTQFRVGEHPLFTPNGINRKLLGSENTTNPKADFNLHKALAELQVLSDRIRHGEEVDAEMAEVASNNIIGVCRVLGYPVADSMVSEIINSDNILYLTKNLGFIVKDLDAAAKANKKDHDPFAFKKENSIGGTLRNFLTPITDQLEDTATNAFYDSGKMYQSYVTPSFMTKLLQKFRLEGQDFEDFLEGEYGNSEWFKFKGRNGAWRNEWLRMLATNEDTRKIFDHKVELNFDKHSYMRNMTDAEYTLSLFAEYFAESSDDKQSLVPAWFRIPMQSNKPSSEFIKFYSYRGATYKEDIVHGLHSMYLQELSRIQTVNMRNKSKDDPSFIKNFDKNGKQFNFLPFLNSYLDNSTVAKKGRNLLETEAENNELASLLQKRIDTTKKLTPTEESRLDELVDRAIYNHMETRAQEILNRWEQEGILEAAKQVEGVGTEDADVRRAIENYLWNDCFAAKNILQLTVGDIAFYKDAEDLQKRLAQLHAPGIRGNVAATDYQGKRVSDGYYRTFILQDFDTFKSNIIANIAEVFDRKIADAPESQKAQLRALKESLVGKDGKYTKINVTDAQGYSSPSSYRKKALMFGKWSHKAEDIYQKLLSGDYTYTDLETAFQPLKPFVYTHLEKHIGDDTPIETMNVPFQAKNSEYLLIMADAIMQSEVNKSGELSRPNLLRAVYRVMEDSERLNPTKGIDTVQFESAIKSGLQGKMNIHQFAEVAGGEEAAYTFMMSQIYQNYDPKKPVEGQEALQYNTDTFVHEASYEDYCLQQEVPEHFKGHQQAHGSQIRMITPSDLDLYKDPNGNPNDENNINYYEWTEPDGTKRKVRADEFKREYEETIAANIEESIENLSKELHLDSSDKKGRNIALSKILLREILSSPRYGVDLAQACAVDKNTGEFRIPKGDPIQAKRIEQLINSIIKNRVNKQKIAGGPIVQVTNFGTSKQLHIRFNHKNGGLLLTREEYEGWEAATHQTYEEYVKENQAGIAYFEVFIPIWANEIFEKFANEDGTIDVKAIEAIDPDLLKMISYRIPTEDKYSCAPMKVVGFMPREAGDAIMLPYELTEIDDSDFDVDKRYVMRKDIQIVENKPAIEKLLIQRVSESYAKAHDGKVNKRFITEQVKMYMDNPDRMKTADKLMEAIHREKQVIMKLYKDKVWKTIKPTSGKLYRDNKIVDMTWAVLTNEKTADKILNPGGFDNFKRAGYMAAAYRLHSGEYTWQQLQAMSIDALSDLCYVDKDLTWADTQIQFYKQNAAAASLIGVFAVNKVAHATLEGDDNFLAVDEICGEEPFAIAATQFSGRMQVDPKYDSLGNLIGKTLGSGVSASADAAKTPVLNLLNINMTTVGTFTSLLRLGMPHEDACMFIGQDVIARVLDEFNRQNLTGYASLNSVIDKEIKRLKEAHNISDDADINKEPLSKEELVRGLTPEEHEVIDYKVLIAFQKAKAIAESMRKISFATRFNSISSAVGPLIIDNLIMEHKMEQFMDENADTHFYTHDDIPVDITDVFADHPILKQFAKTVKIARQMTADMPAGSTGFRNLLAKLPDDIKEKIYNDKKLFSNLSDFYQSYLAIASGLINPANLKNYIDGFPKWFMKQDFKERYPDNALIQAIQMTVSKKTGRAFLSIKLTGEDETVKETYRNAWIDLHKSNPELSQQLFEYCFFRAGIGFSPKTFMAVVPTYVKERLQKKLSNGETATYLDTYRRFPTVTEELVIDQFITNNWEDNKLVPKKGGKNSHFTIKGDHLYATVQEDIDDLEGLTYIKTSGKGVTYLWKKVSDDKAGVHYVKMKPLGNNGEYVEMGLSEISSPLTATTQTSENNDASEIKTTSPSETDATEVESKPVTPKSKKAVFVANLAKDYMTYNESSFGRKISEAKAQAQANEMAEHPERFGSLMQKILESKGVKVNKDEAIRKLKDLDLC